MQNPIATPQATRPKQVTGRSRSEGQTVANAKAQQVEGKVAIARTIRLGKEVKLLYHPLLYPSEHATAQNPPPKLTSETIAVELDRTSPDSLEGIAYELFPAHST